MIDFSPNGLVTIASDFGTRDGYVGAMKGVILGVSAGLRLCDIGHDVPAQSVIAASMMLRAACPFFPAGTVHLGVIDPGVGTDRHEIVALAGGHAFVGPDNGIFSLAWQALGGLDECWRIEDHPHLLAAKSATFHGRDVFAPTAAAIAASQIAPSDVGSHVDPVRMLLPLAVCAAGRTRGEILYCDHFGNAVTNIERPLVRQVGKNAEARIGSGRVVAVMRTYGDVKPGQAVALIGSSGRLEIAVRDGSAAEQLGLEPGTAVEVVSSTVTNLRG